MRYRRHRQVRQSATGPAMILYSRKRNCLSDKRARDLVYVHSNLRLIDNLRSLDYQETTIQWEEWGLSHSEDDDDASDSAAAEVD